MVVSYNYILSLVKKKMERKTNYFLTVILSSPGIFICQPPIAKHPVQQTTVIHHSRIYRQKETPKRYRERNFVDNVREKM
jgi:hypothetical protein